jgi:uncharacterized membrane protein YdbT with pleckstrin-like domain
MPDPIITLKPKLYIPLIGTLLGWIILVVAIILVFQYALPEYLKYILNPQILGIAACIIILMAAWEYLSMLKTVYKVYPDRIEFQESFFTQTTTSIPRERIDGVTLHHGWVADNIFKTGSITLITKEKSIVLDYLGSSDETYSKLLDWQSGKKQPTVQDLPLPPAPEPKSSS